MRDNARRDRSQMSPPSSELRLLTLPVTLRWPRSGPRRVVLILKNQHFPTRLVSVVTAISNRLSTIKNGRPKAANSTENETRTVGDGQPAPSEECLIGAADRFRLCTSPSERGTVG